MELELLDAIRNVSESFPEVSGKYELELTKIAAKISDNSLLENLEDSFVKVNQTDNNFAYAIFFVVVTKIRHNDDFEGLRKQFDTHGVLFSNHPTFSHLQLLMETSDISIINSSSLMQRAYKDTEKIPNNAGVLHFFAELVAKIYERENESEQKDIKELWYEKAIQAIDKAIELEIEYAKYYSTKARLLSIDNKFDEAIRLSDKAINLENSDRTDYSVRIGSYQYFKTRINFQREKYLLVTENDAIKSKVDSLLKKVDASTVKNLEFLGFFSGVIALIVATVQVSISMPIHDASKLILVLVGALLIGFTGFSFSLGEQRINSPRIIMPIVIGVAMLCTGILL
jgi:tetratricopeptide (TPR) repeat protein